jgi:hypothetical protein
MGVIVMPACYNQMTMRTAVEWPLRIEETRALDRELGVVEDYEAELGVPARAWTLKQVPRLPSTTAVCR